MSNGITSNEERWYHNMYYKHRNEMTESEVRNYERFYECSHDFCGGVCKKRCFLTRTSRKGIIDHIPPSHPEPRRRLNYKGGA